jgi:hypothetical protein
MERSMGASFFLPIDGHSYFGKNSSMGKGQAQSIRIRPRRAAAGPCAIGGRELELSDTGQAYVCSALGGAAGSDMGVNEAGVAIGLEATFSKFNAEAEGPSGAEFLEAALMAATSAEAARDILIGLTERYGQAGLSQGPGGRRASASYLISGFDGAFIVETAAKRWAWKALDAGAAFSDTYTMDIDYKRVDAATRKSIALVNERMACLDEADAGRVADKESWKFYAEDKRMLRLGSGDADRRALGGLLGAAAESGNRQSAFALLRVHAADDPEKPRRPRDICRHEGLLGGALTAASMLIERKQGDARFLCWFTGAPLPCANLFKPILFDGGFKPLWTAYDYFGQGPEGGERYWRERLEASKGLLRRPAKADESAAALAAAQAELSMLADGLLSSPAPASESALEKARERSGAIVAGWDRRA